MSQPNERVAATPRPDGHVADLVDDYLHKLLDPDRAAVVERHCESCPGCKAALDDARRRWAALRAVPPAEAAEQLVHTTMQKIDAHRLARKRRWRRFLWAAGTALAASVVVLAWLHVATANLSATPYDLVVLGQRDLLASTNNSLRVLLRDPKTLAPLANIPVTLQLVDRVHNQTADLGGFTTDAHGDGQPRFTLPDWPDAAYELRVVAQTPGAPETADLSVTLKRASKVMLSTDKPVYQPGQVIHARALALRRPDLHPVAGDTAAFSVIDPKGNVVFKLLDKTSRYGIAAADCPLDTEILEGAYTVVGKVGDVESRVSVEVKKYVLPKFKVAVTTDKPFYKESETVKLTVQADYFFGKPVAGAEVKVDAKDDAPGGVAGVLEGRTDAKGTAHFDFVVQPHLAVGQPAPPSDPCHVHFLAMVTDSAGQKQAASAGPAVSALPAHLDVIAEAGGLVKNTPNRIYVLVTNLDGRLAASAHVALTNAAIKLDDKAIADESGAAVFELPALSGTPLLQVSATDGQGVEIARRDITIASGPTNDFLVRPDKAVYRGGDTMTLTALGGGGGPVFVDLIKDGQTLRTETIETTHGPGETAVDLSADLAGTVQVVAYRLDAQGWPVRRTRLVYVRPADEVHIAATLDPGKTAYKPGERPTLRLKLTDNEGKPCPGAVSLAGVDEAVFSVLPQRPGTEQAFYTLDKELMEPIYKIHPWSPDEAVSERYLQALFAAASRADPVHQGPTQPNGLPVKEATPFMKDVESALPTATTHTLMAQTYQAKEQRTEDLRAMRLAWIKWGWAWLVIGVIAAALLAFWLFGQTSVLVKSLVTGYVVIPFLLFALAAALVAQGFSVGAKFAGLAKSSQPLSEDRALGSDWGDEPAMAPPAELKVNTPDLPPGAGEAPRPRVREMFPETLLWRPEVITDDDGAASLPLDLADSITTWRLSASAVTGDGRLGAAELPVKVFQDFFVDLNLPVALTRGDEIAVPVVVYNYLDKPQTVTLNLANADWFKRLDATEQRLEMAPNEVRSVRYRLRVEKVGVQSLTVEAHGAKDSDAVKRSVEVVPDGRPVEQVVNGTLEKPASVEMVLPENHIPGSEKAFVKIYPSSFSQLVEGLDNIFQMPYGCFEQTSSTTYRNILALDYLKRTGRSAPAVEAKARGYIHLGYQRLLSFEVAGGGFDWFGNPPANRALTAYGLMEFADMARVQDVDPVLIERTRRWLLSQRRPDGSWDPEDRRMHDDAVGGGARADDAGLAETAYVAWVVYGDPAGSSDAAATFAYLKRRGPETITDPHTLALVCNALLAVDEHNPEAGPYLDRLEIMKRTSDDGKFAWWAQAPGLRTTFYGAGRGGEVETTALAALALLRAGGHGETTREALTWLTSQKDPKGTWYSTQATVLALKALLAGTGKPLNGDGERVVEVRLNGEVVRTVTIPAEQSDVLKQVDVSALLKPGKQRLTLTEARGAAVGFAASFRYNEPAAEAAGRKEALSVDLQYDRTEVAVGEQIAATATVTSGKASAPMVMVELPVPAGFAASADDFAALTGPGKKIAKVQTRPGQVLLYLTGLDAGESLKATYHLRALTPAKVTAAGARAYEYYDPDKQGSSPAERLTVNARD